MDQVWLVPATVVAVLFLELVVWQAVRILGKGKVKHGDGGAKPQAKIPDKKPRTRRKPSRPPSNRRGRAAARQLRSWPRCSARPASSTSSRNRWIAIATPRSGPRSATCIAIAAKCSTASSPSASMVDQEEGSPVEVPPGFDAGRYRLTGNVAGDPPFHGRLAHHGWEAAEVQLPAWSGTQGSSRVVARWKWNWHELQRAWKTDRRRNSSWGSTWARPTACWPTRRWTPRIRPSRSWPCRNS